MEKEQKRRKKEREKIKKGGEILEKGIGIFKIGLLSDLCVTGLTSKSRCYGNVLLQ